MKLSLLQKRYNIAIISFVLLSSLLGKRMFASPGEHVYNPPRSHATAPQGGSAGNGIGDRMYFTPACPIIAQNFNNAADVNGATSDPSATGWYLDASRVPN